MYGYAGNEDYLRQMDLLDQQAKDAEYIEMLQRQEEPEPKHTKLHYDWFKYNLYKLGHLKPDEPMWSENKIIDEYWTYFPPSKRKRIEEQHEEQHEQQHEEQHEEKRNTMRRIEGGRMRYKSTRRRGKTNRRRVKTHRRRHRKH
jgi:hypothetical protein